MVPRDGHWQRAQSSDSGTETQDNSRIAGIDDILTGMNMAVQSLEIDPLGGHFDGGSEKTASLYNRPGIGRQQRMMDGTFAIAHASEEDCSQGMRFGSRNGDFSFDGCFFYSICFHAISVTQALVRDSVIIQQWCQLKVKIRIGKMDKIVRLFCLSCRRSRVLFFIFS